MSVVLKYLWGTLKSITGVIAGAFVVPVALLQAGRERLPQWAQMWDNDREPFGDTARYPAINAAHGWEHLWLRYQWLAFRNPANNLGRMLGVSRPAVPLNMHWGNPNTSDQGESGYRFTKQFDTDTWELVAFEFYLVWAYCATRCLRVRLGWKLWDDPARLCHVINPVMTFTGKR